MNRSVVRPKLSHLRTSAIVKEDVLTALPHCCGVEDEVSDEAVSVGFALVLGALPLEVDEVVVLELVGSVEGVAGTVEDYSGGCED